ncbi:Uracil-DNA glycosylase superfamily [Catenulispora acidiphila DSM 44928]|uniref:Uracil-DNA glycosylase superfamily n=1 Tax=Catenulispora acidiphila (strain DSM 44928 / JCM 14897 / NBRC 102108 / NRRL B-24433 / ID139908) TaxID=479433 RepID=C7PW99_CATAD|nr:G/U mismatch-specific DNA glycosylase [Catenulispora acidiphila]ACU73347.1 Uracil-DNA glycosylase superfamily [Catenulispora acidiphila DSM 44928]
MARYTPEDLAAANGRTLADVIAPHLNVLFCGINPGLLSALTGHHFARPGNRFWPALHRSGFTPRQLAPHEQDHLITLGLGITNVVPRATAGAAELRAEEYRTGGEALRAKVAEYRPRWLAIVGIGAYRVAFDAPKAVMGRQELTLGETGVWVLPNPSGLNAHYNVDTLAAAYAELRVVVEGEGAAAS